MADINFEVSYDGDALKTGIMNVRELAPALLGLGELLEEANRVVYGSNAAISVNVRAEFQPGSFKIKLMLDFMQHAKGFFSSSDDLKAALNLLNVIGVVKKSGNGLFGLLKKLKGKQPDRVTQTNSNSFVFEAEKIRIEVPYEVFKLYQDIPTRKAAQSIVEPLLQTGIDKLFLKTEDDEGETLTKEEAEADFYSVPILQEEPLDNSRKTAWFSILSIAFKEDNKWRLSDGTSPFYVAIEDKEFLRKVDQNLEYFSKGDLLHAELETRQFALPEGGLRTEYFAIRILEHRSAAKQIPLPLEKSTPPELT